MGNNREDWGFPPQKESHKIVLTVESTAGSWKILRRKHPFLVFKMVVFSYVSRWWFQRYFSKSSSPFFIFIPQILNHIVQVFLSYFLSHPKIVGQNIWNLPGQCHHLCSGFGCEDLRELGGSRFFRQNKSQQNRSKKFPFNFQHSNLNSSFFHSICWIRWCVDVFWISQTIFFQENIQKKHQHEEQ